MMKMKICLALILLFSCSLQIVFAQEKIQPEQKKVLVCSDCGFPINSKAVNLLKPEYPKVALMVNASGVVQIQVTIDETGNVIEAKAVSGHPLLQAASVKAALQTKFEPAFLSGKPIRVSGVIVYNFVSDLPIQPKLIEEQPQQSEIPKGKPIRDIGRGIVIGKATKLPKPPFIFCNCRFGNVNSINSVIVQVEIDEQGNVTKANAVSGHPILKMASEKAARKSKFTPTLISGVPVKAKTTITYKFVSVNKGSVKLKSIIVKNVQAENQ